MKRRVVREIPVSADPVEREEEINTIERTGTLPLTVGRLLRDIEAALKFQPRPACGLDHANRERLSAVWKIVNNAKRRLP